MKPRRCPAWVPALVLVLTVAQLIVAVAVPGIERFEGKAFEYRLAFYQGTELEGAYEDTLSDEVLGTLGAFLAGLVVARRNAAPD